MGKTMKILLVAVNAKYIHTCPAVYSLRAYAMAAGQDQIDDVRIDDDRIDDVRIDIAEYTINDRYQDVLSGIMGENADIIGFSVYIWNVDRIRRLIRDIRRILGDEVKLWAGGPEATWYPAPFLLEDGADLCIRGEGEVVFRELVMFSVTKKELLDIGTYPEDLPGLAFVREGEILDTGLARPAKLDEIPFLYSDLSLFDNRILYYEASRGCPFACAYCLSGRERGIRCRDLQLVKKELQFFLDEKVKQVKFVDRTFNAVPEFALAIWTYLRDHDNGVTNFHFEIEADRITEEELILAAGLRPGLIQMEIGVQSANEQTLRSVHRSPKLDRVQEVMKRLAKNQNINLHLDLIAGLPFEGMDSFRRSFQTVYEMRPNQLQLGFLKLLKGTELYDRREEYGLVCSSDAPYEVLKTNWLSYGELEQLHRISDRVEEYYNSQGFRRSLPLVETLYPDAFSLFEDMAGYYREYGYDLNRPSVQKRYGIFKDFVQRRLKECGLDVHAYSGLMEMLRFDQALHVHPSRRMCAEEEFDFGEGPVRIRIDHRVCSPVNGEASWTMAGNNSCPNGIKGLV